MSPQGHLPQGGCDLSVPPAPEHIPFLIRNNGLLGGGQGPVKLINRFSVNRRDQVKKRNRKLPINPLPCDKHSLYLVHLLKVLFLRI